MKPFLILDCYVDEPTCLGVPPFLSPYPRYIAGALRDAGISESDIVYRTIDAVRETEYRIDGDFAEVFLIGGASVPGRYLGEKIGTYAEIARIIAANPHRISIGGMIAHLPTFDELTGNFRAVRTDIEVAAWYAARGAEQEGWRTQAQTARWSMLGAFIAARHPHHPQLIAEMETYRGCPRENRCSYCSENVHTAVTPRAETEIHDEIHALMERGITRFRLGRQADILCYGSTPEYRRGFPRPAPERLHNLFAPLAALRESGRIALLSIDNANPGTIVNWPDESGDILSIIASAVTEGDTMPLGAETFDDALIAANGLKATREEIIGCIRRINDAGGHRRNGIPVLLPGVNLLHGLIGETDRTFRINYETLQRIRDEGLLVRRINIRKIVPFPGTPLATAAPRMSGRIANRFEYYKERIRAEIDHAMLQRVYPAGTIIRAARVDEVQHGYSLGRQIASYPIICKTPYTYPLRSFHDLVVTGHRERSLEALPAGAHPDTMPLEAIRMIPGVGKAASALLMNKPLTRETFLAIAPSADTRVLDGLGME